MGISCVIANSSKTTVDVVAPDDPQGAQPITWQTVSDREPVQCPKCSKRVYSLHQYKHDEPKFCCRQCLHIKNFS